MRLPRLTLIVPALLTLAACASASTPAVTTAAASAAGAPLRVCVTDDALPWSSKNPTTPGVEIEYGQQVATTLGRTYEPVWIPTFDQLIPSLRSGKCDAVINGLYITSERAKLVSFSNPTWGSRYEIVMRKGESANSLADLKGRCVASLKGSVTVDELRAAGISPRTFGTNDETLRSVSSGACDAAIVESPTAGWSLKQPEFSGLAIVPALTGKDTFYVGVAIDQGNPDLLAQVNDAVAKVRASGALEEILQRYGVPSYLP